MKEIRAILAAYQALDLKSQKVALALVVRVEGSSYRRAGARMLVVDNGTWTGGISGGCLEGDALRKANHAIHMQNPSIVTYDTTQDDDKQIGVGLGCNGIIDVMFIPIDPNDKHNAISLLQKVSSDRDTRILLTITHGDLDAERGFGHSWIYDPDNERNLNEDWRDAIDEIRSKNRSSTITLPNEMGDSVKVFVEVIKPAIQLYICGGNYDIYPLVRIASELGWEVQIQANPNKLHQDAFKLAKKVWTKQEMPDGFDSQSAVLLMAHDFNTDKENLQKYIATEASYIGLLGPKDRSEKILNELTEEGTLIPAELEEKLHYPTGLDLGAVNPEEIALSICAEIVAFFSGRNAKPLKLRAGKIYG